MPTQLFGIFATRSPESCPLNNKKSRDTMIEIDDKIKSITEKFHVKSILGFYMSVLEHQWVIIVEAEALMSWNPCALKLAFQRSIPSR